MKLAVNEMGTYFLTKFNKTTPIEAGMALIGERLKLLRE